MTSVNKLVLLGLLPAIATAATPAEEAYLEGCRAEPGMPVPIAVVSPDVSPSDEGGLVNLEFMVDSEGCPGEFRIMFATNEALAAKVVDAVKRWRFMPAGRDGAPVPMRVALPVKVVGPVAADDRFVARD